MVSGFRTHWADFVTPIRDAIVDAFPPGTTRRHRRVTIAAELIARTTFAEMMLPGTLKTPDLVDLLKAFAASTPQTPP